MTSARQALHARAQAGEGRAAWRGRRYARPPRAGAPSRVPAILPLYEGKSFWQHDPYYAGRGRGKRQQVCAVCDCNRELRVERLEASALCMRNVGRSTDQRTYIVELCRRPFMATRRRAGRPDVGTTCSSLTGFSRALVLDYIVRMKVSANLNWFYLETIPVPERDERAYWVEGPRLVERLNAIGADFPIPSTDPFLNGPQIGSKRASPRLARRRPLRPHADDFAHIATRFPIYDRDAPESLLGIRLSRRRCSTRLHPGGRGGWQRRAARTPPAGAAAGVGFGFDELWQPDGGWERANREAREILDDNEKAA